MLDLWAAALTVVGAIAWGLYGLFGLNIFRRGMAAPVRVERLLYTAIGVAGAWIGIVVSTPVVLATLGLKGLYRAPRRAIRAIGGRTLPTIGGTTLRGREVLLPSDTLGLVTFLVVGFSYDQRPEATRWIQAIKDRFAYSSDVEYYLIAMVPGIYGPLSPLVDVGLRWAFASELHDHILAVHGSTGSFRRVLAASPVSNVWLYLLDRDGRVVFQYGGSFDEDVFSEMVSEAERALRRIEFVPAGGRVERPRAA